MRIDIFELSANPLRRSARADNDPDQAPVKKIACLLNAEGEGALPAIFIDGKLAGNGQALSVVELEKALAVRGVRL